MRPDIVYVTSRSVYREYEGLVARDVAPCTNAWDAFCRDHIAAAVAAGDGDAAEHWRRVLDFGTRYGCSMASAVEADGERVREPIGDAGFRENPIRVYIGNPLNPPHVDGQPDITPERMAAVNARYLEMNPK